MYSEGAEPQKRRIKPGSQSALKAFNQRSVTQRLLGSASLTQAELSRATGLSTASISNIVRALVQDGIAETSPTISSGRRALLVRLSNNGAVSVGIDFGRSHVRIVIVTLDYRIVAEQTLSLEIRYSALHALSLAAERLDAMLCEFHIPRTAVLGVGVGIPGPINLRSQTVIHGNVLPEWIGVSVSDIENHMRFPVVIDNDANLGALCEVTWGPHSSTENLIFIKVGTGIGAGLIINGRQFKGALGLSGEVGHIPTSEHGLLCRCGNRGCLETVASTRIMIERLSLSEHPSSTTADIVRLALDGDSETRRVVEDAGFAIGRMAAILSDVLNPHAVVIGGPLSAMGEVFLEPIRRGLNQYAMPLISETTTVTASSFGDRAEALGAAALVLSQQDIHPFVV
ncbi:ArsR family transcriptional regulator [Subtercola boreus]|uniref:ArsR family transcriptional regulator n=1 Tax=Subtercola boreus TaxID=120213 RepID=A0A3E0VRK3_9MICO|nr:ROK family transcriptional regulator [Subtercola boreus]RFA12078.1 ArsR family transcriptional regulator [Subtercola boreus]